jgi:ABC-type branched-subunit amino acid transport system substrate-binding protein
MPRSPAAYRIRLFASAGLVVALLVAAGCSTRAAKTGAAATHAATHPARVATGPGVTDSTITLGVLTDQTGPFAEVSQDIQVGRTLFWDERNADGGVCGRKVQFLVRDHRYEVPRAVTSYAELRPKVLAFAELLGSPQLAALDSQVRADRILTMAASWSSRLLSNPYLVITGATYDVEAIDGISWLVQHQGLHPRDTIGHIYLNGDYGQDAAAGSRAAAAGYGLHLVERMIEPTDRDLSAQIGALRDAGARYVVLSTTPAQTVAAIEAADATGYRPSFLASAPAFHPALLHTPARDTILRQLLVTTQIAPFGSVQPGPTRVRAVFQDRYPGRRASLWINVGYAQAMVTAQILQAACDRRTLTRPGLMTALHSIRHFDTGGLVPPVDYSQSGKIPTREVNLAEPAIAALGGLTMLYGPLTAPLAVHYQPTG